MITPTSWRRSVCSAEKLLRHAFGTKELGPGRALVQGDDFIVAGPKKGVDRVKRNMKKRYAVKVRAVLGGDANNEIKVLVLGPTVHWGQEGVELEAAGRPGELTKKQMGIEPGSNGVVSPLVRDDTGEGKIEEKLRSSESCRYRAVAAGAFYP